MSLNRPSVSRLLKKRTDYYIFRPKEAELSQNTPMRSGSNVSAERLCLEWFAIELANTKVWQETALVFGTGQRVQLNLLAWRPRQHGIYHGVNAYCDMSFKTSDGKMLWHASMNMIGRGILDFECSKELSGNAAGKSRQLVLQSRAFIRPHSTKTVGFGTVDHYHLRPLSFKR